MEVKNSTLWKFMVINGQLMRECTFCGYKCKTQPIYCPNCQKYMRRGKCNKDLKE